MKTKLTSILTILLFGLHLSAQNANANKYSPMIRRIANENKAIPQTRAAGRNTDRVLMALVKCSNPNVLQMEGCKTIYNWGDIYATSIPMSRLANLANHKEVKRIEASKPCEICVDTTATLLGVSDVRAGFESVPGLTGKGVVMGIQDIGFDLTHPTFYSRDMKDYRIKAFWDMLDPDTIDSGMFVGKDFRNRDALMHKAVATDGMKQTHGVHTAGIAAGSGYDSPYIGMAPEADLCFVANAVGSDAEFIPEEDEYKYTSATDLLGFQYIFDYAESVGKPCVISFSEGSHEDLYGDAKLLYEVLEKMTGPGRIIVASAGNSSANKTYMHKPIGVDSISSFIYGMTDGAYYTLRHSDKTDIQLHFSLREDPGKPVYTKSVTTDFICSLEDSLLIDTLKIGEEKYQLLMASYPSCYNAEEWATELYIRVLTREAMGVGYDQCVRLTLTGREEDVECFASGGLFYNFNDLPEYHTSESTHNINFPAAASSVIAVGGTAYRTGAINYKGKWKSYDMGNDGRRWKYSSVGPTMEGLIKPDVVAPACNIISAYSSYYLENNPNASDISWDVSHFNYAKREYAWNCNSGTSMSSPIVGGIVALWLQLCPTLSPQDVMQVIQATSKRYDPQLTYPNNEYGWGEIDALAGAKYIKEHFDCSNNIDLTDAEDNNLSHVAIYDIMGRSVNNATQKGIYIKRYKDGKTKKFAQE